jgi:hypothetical protein
MFAEGVPGFALVGIANGIEKACGGEFILEGRYADTREGAGLPWLSQAFCDRDCPQWPKSDFDILLSLPLAYVEGEMPARHRISIAGHTSRLVLTLNHEVNGFHPEPGGDLDLVLPDSFEAGCQRYHGVETCKVQNPPPGEYSVGIRAVSGNPAYQLTAVAIYE